MLYFHDFDIGQAVGRCEIHADPTALCLGEAGGSVRMDILSTADLLALLMRGYCRIVTPRPPGNIHASQTVRFLDKASIGDVLEVSLTCIDKTAKNDRKWLRFEAAVNRGPTKVMEADMTFIWAR